MPRLPERSRALLALLALPALLAVPGAAIAQAPPLRTVLPQWIGLIAAPGHEQAATKAIMRTSPAWRAGPLGTLVSRSGSGSPRRVIACSLDLPAFAVSEIRPDGYLRVHDAEPGRRHPLWDQFHEGQRVLVQTRSGVRAGVFAVKSTHLWRRRAQDQLPVTTDDLWLDVGATSAREVAALGIQLLDPVVRELPQWRYGADGDPFIAGPGAAQRSGCAVVAALAESGPRRGENVYVIATQSSFGDAGLLAAIARIDSVDEVLVLAPQSGRDSSAAVTAARLAPRTAGTLGAAARLVHAAAVRARFAGTLMESVRASDADGFAVAMATAADVPVSALRPVSLPTPFVAPPTTAVRDALSPTGDLLGRLTDVYAVSGHEQPMRDAVLAELPAWARDKTVVDTAGNLVLALGPDRDTTVVMAHMDEIGFEVTRIAPDGTVSLAQRGGFFPSLWEGQTALLHVGEAPGITRVDDACGAASSGPIRGLFIPRDSASRKQPAALTAWFGLDSAALVARGVGVGSAITSYKCATRLADGRFTARSIDDRAGCTALILAVRELDPKALQRKVIFVWSVREETGLDGAGAIAAQLGPTVRRVHAVDTFVSSDSPLESQRFADTPIGAGAVVRALDNSSVTPPAETDRVVSIARLGKIPLQVGTTNGGNDGSQLVRYGAVDVPLAWPLRYSHSPAELIDLRDVRSLASLVRAVILAP
jgi:putative aminopeptidase FrvX